MIALLTVGCEKEDIVNPVALAEGNFLCSIYEKSKLLSLDKTTILINRSDSLNRVNLLIIHQVSLAQTPFDRVKVNINATNKDKVDLYFKEPSGELIGYVWKSDIFLNFVVKKDTILTIKGKKIEKI